MTHLDLDQLRTVLAANSFRHFVEAYWSCVSSDKFKPGYLVDVLCNHLQAVQAGEIKRLAIACPIRSGKSILTSVMFPVYSWLKDPSIRILSASCTEDLASRDSLRSRQLIESPQFQQMFGGVFRLVEDQNQKTYYVNDRKGHRKAVGLGTSGTGQDADYVLVDDLMDYKKAKSEAERRNAIDFYEKILERRIVQGTGKERVVVAGHRVHQDDLFNRVWETFGNDGTWTYLVLPTEADPTRTNAYFNGIGWQDARQPGELLNPERYPAKVISQEKKSLRHEFACIHNQDPTPAAGDLFKPDWFRYWTDHDSETYNLGGKLCLKAKAWRFVTVDTAISTSSSADYTVAQCWDVMGSHLVLVDQLRKRLDGNKIVPALNEFYNVHRPQFVAVEKQFVGQFVIDQLRNLNVPVKSFDAKRWGDKETRAVSAEIRMEAGQVWFPANKDFVAELQREILAFPNGANDDQLDCMAEACLLATKYQGRVEEPLTPSEQEAKQKTDREKRFNDLLWQGCPF